MWPQLGWSGGSSVAILISFYFDFSSSLNWNSYLEVELCVEAWDHWAKSDASAFPAICSLQLVPNIDHVLIKNFLMTMEVTHIIS